MADDNVEVQYIHPSLVSRHGVKPFKVSPSLAKEYENKGWAKILTTLPQTNPSLSKKEIEEIEKKYDDYCVPYMREEENFSIVCWIDKDYVDKSLLKSGTKFGFKTYPLYANSLSTSKMLKSDLIILNCNLGGFSDMEIMQIKTMLFQKSIPYVLRFSESIHDINWTRQALLFSKLNIFRDENIFSQVIDLFDEEMCNTWLIEEYSDNYYAEFWKEIHEVTKE